MYGRQGTRLSSQMLVASMCSQTVPDKARGTWASNVIAGKPSASLQNSQNLYASAKAHSRLTSTASTCLKHSWTTQSLQKSQDILCRGRSAFSGCPPDMPDTISGAAILRNGTPHLLAIALASAVLPQPGGPCNRSPLGGLTPSQAYTYKACRGQLAGMQEDHNPPHANAATTSMQLRQAMC